MNRIAVTLLFIIIITKAFTQDLPADLSNRSVAIEHLTLEEFNQRKINRLKSAQDSALISPDWQIEQFRNNKRADKSFGRDYQKFVKALKKKGVKYMELARVDFEKVVNSNTSSDKYLVYQDFTVYEDGNHLIIVVDVKLLSPNKEVIYTGSWKGLEKRIIKHLTTK